MLLEDTGLEEGGVIWGPHGWVDVQMGGNMRGLVLKNGI